MPPDELTRVTLGRGPIAVQFEWSPQQLESIRTRNTADDPESWGRTFERIRWRFSSRSPALAERATRPCGFRRGGPRTRRSRSAGRTRAQAPGSKEPSEPSDLALLPPGVR
jgi:hypothetical protein